MPIIKSDEIIFDEVSETPQSGIVPASQMKFYDAAPARSGIIPASEMRFDDEQKPAGISQDELNTFELQQGGQVLSEAVPAMVTGLPGFVVGTGAKIGNAAANILQGVDKPFSTAIKQTDEFLKPFIYEPKTEAGTAATKGLTYGMIAATAPYLLPFLGVGEALDTETAQRMLSEEQISALKIANDAMMMVAPVAKQAVKLSRAETAARKAAGLDQEAVPAVVNDKPTAPTGEIGIPGYEPSAKAVESPTIEPVAKKPQVDIVENNSYLGNRQGALMGTNDVQLVARDAAGKDLGRIWYTKEADGITIRKIEVEPASQRQGIATELMRQAEAKDGPRLGSTAQTPEGEAFVNSYQENSVKLEPPKAEPIPETPPTGKESLQVQPELKPEEITPSGLPKEQTLSRWQDQPIAYLKDKLSDVDKALGQDTKTVQVPAVKPGMEESQLARRTQDEPGGAIAAGGISYGMDLPKKAGGGTSINLERIDSDYSAKFLINQIAEQYKGKIDEARRGKITLDETKKLADDLGMTEDQLLRRRKGQAFNAEQATAARDVLNTSARNVIEAQNKATSGATSDLVNFRLAMSRHAAVQAEVSGIATEAGRALSAHRILSKEITAEAKGQKAMLDALGGRELTENILGEMQKIDPTNVAEVNRFIQAFSKVKLSDKIYEAWINFILSGPKTHIANVIGNTATATTKPLERAIAATVEKGLSRIQGRKAERFFGEVNRDALGMMAGVIDGSRAALRTFKTEVPSDALMKIEQAKYKAIKGKTGEIIRLPGRFLMAADEFFKSINYTGEIYAQAYRKAKMEGLKGEALANKSAEYVKDPTLGMIEQARFEAQVRTFTNPYGKYTQYLDRVRNIPGVRYIVPFLRTPTNIAKFALERTPLNFPRIAYKAYKGEFKGAEIADELAKPMLGSLIAAAVVALASQDLITGGGPKEKAKRDAMFRTGWKPYSVKIGDQYVSYGRLEPIGSIAGMSADFVDLAKETDDEKQLSDYAQGIAMSISKNITSKTFMQGVSNMMDAISDPKRYGENWIEMTAGSVVPAIVGTGARAIDETRREVHGPGEAILNRLPFLSETLTPKRDVWGREIKDDRTAVERGMSPIDRGTESTNKVDIELKKLGITPSLPGKKLAGVTLSPIQYDIYLKESGQLAYELVKDVIDSSYGSDKEETAKAVKSAIQKARDMVKKELIDQWNLTKETDK